MVCRARRRRRSKGRREGGGWVRSWGWKEDIRRFVTAREKFRLAGSCRKFESEILEVPDVMRSWGLHNPGRSPYIASRKLDGSIRYPAM